LAGRAIARYLAASARILADRLGCALAEGPGCALAAGLGCSLADGLGCALADGDWPGGVVGCADAQPAVDAMTLSSKSAGQ